MIKIEENNGDLFNSLNQTDYFVHACNGQKTWGGGIAYHFKKYFPNAYKKYTLGSNTPGAGYYATDNGYKIGCLITSKGFGMNVDMPKEIVKNTYNSIKNLLNQIAMEDKNTDIVIHSPKINAGLFNTPWEDTKKAIIKAGNESDLNIIWKVWIL